jgi:ribosomal protein S27AE
MSTYDAEWFYDRLRERGVSAECPRCGETTWTGLGDDHDLIVRLPAFDYAGTEQGQIADLGGMACVNCGFLSLHAMALLLGDAGTWPARDS